MVNGCRAASRSEHPAAPVLYAASSIPQHTSLVLPRQTGWICHRSRLSRQCWESPVRVATPAAQRAQAVSAAVRASGGAPYRERRPVGAAGPARASSCQLTRARASAASPPISLSIVGAEGAWHIGLRVEKRVDFARPASPPDGGGRVPHASRASRIRPPKKTGAWMSNSTGNAISAMRLRAKMVES